ncbi:hypothetical protein [Tenacibaculum finnmarkense]|uniref:Uncharacterized protein n=1 Tax=Tenacibaculum finnmarkense genomovar finnmarkense TaxID=1458503 RepID=A0AAP1WGU6_9FLAO|nr:hypothetical protein [Tenacibaculum finnmarkense]MBE7653380.1 hypothetical protein [Tenacibaculum finnmarkense genomovar finnmarkense]MBE7695680.1 hypothetical protein [Tenacibaculum finnmarkense genomovar finnmarkense]MCD8427659.1 hypothetical protein [Tenacibaculum finnmarkense genomovar finnmarkense]MCG8753125.1 hypothetical protein [Tenacibaculum finnmarkense]MCG8770509.1 hypothetical protein [Tenacibaculum finnmarkense]
MLKLFNFIFNNISILFGFFLLIVAIFNYIKTIYKNYNKDKVNNSIIYLLSIDTNHKKIEMSIIDEKYNIGDKVDILYDDEYIYIIIVTFFKLYRKTIIYFILSLPFFIFSIIIN